MVVARAGRQVDYFHAGRRDARLAGRIRKAEYRIGIGHVEVIAHEHHAERRVQPCEEDGTRFRDAVTIGVAQEYDSVSPSPARLPGEAPISPSVSSSPGGLLDGRGVQGLYQGTRHA